MIHNRFLSEPYGPPAECPTPSFSVPKEDDLMDILVVVGRLNSYPDTPNCRATPHVLLLMQT